MAVPSIGRVKNLFRFRSPLRGPWLTSVFGAVLLACLPLVVLTGLLDFVAYGPGQHLPADVGWLHLPLFDWPTRPSWLFRLTQGLHVGLGLVLVPVVLAKLWSVIPKLFAWPPVRSVAHALERLSLLLLVGSVLFEIVTGVLNIQYDYVFGFSFYTGHYFGAWVFIASFVTHVALKLPTMIRSLRRRAPAIPRAKEPAPLTMSRRGLLGTVGGGALLVGLLTAGQTVGGPLRDLAFLLPRGTEPGEGANRYPINKTAAAAGVVVREDWRLTVTGVTGRTFTRDELLALPQHMARLPIACVEGWSTVQTWTGVRLRDLAALAGVPEPASAFVSSLEQGPFAQATLNHGQTTDPDALLALRVNGADLSLDHGFPARIIVPALPGVHCTKWVRALDFRSA
ncbi:DMSO/TMAO reductase YedYZ, molybdopterin-dependent catalytic subunit [Amycolatopsis sacchari]|uniref:DMSO/TMAO reductase YedYZ, molybdopterin-dependent catalytic subunit n=1 Tax=Amycolatopsis sacchari TaxID=115433 RepID=A0A1I3Q5Q8_9PSEU|nr:DMSO/TMAO reductase YedYZ, molybdopterin-dependent catalytic subunit [Amycolatopsis sacchari]